LSKGIALSKKSKGIAKIVLSYFSESGKLEWGTLKNAPKKSKSNSTQNYKHDFCRKEACLKGEMGLHVLLSCAHEQIKHILPKCNL
jgi:metal-dependent hydrolase (beta-lactamase superfamily II)